MRRQILEKIEAEKISYDKIAALTGLHRNTVRNYILALSTPLVTTEGRIAKALGV
jgi:transcriptional regulator with XRE-family HTH domain